MGMNSPLFKPPSQRGLPGNRLKQLANHRPLLGAIFEHLHVLDIVEDHQLMWLSTDDSAERRRVEVRFRQQIALAFAHEAGWTMTIHGAFAAATGALTVGFSLGVVGAAMFYFTRWLMR